MKRNLKPAYSKLALAISLAISGGGVAHATDYVVSAANGQVDLVNGDTLSVKGSGSVTSSGGSYAVSLVDSAATVATINNAGHIINASGEGIYNLGSIGSLTNTGSISVGNSGIYGSGTIGSLINTGSITGGGYGIGFVVGTITALTNSGSITGNSYGLYIDGNVTTLTNSGSITGGIRIPGGTITTLINTGSIGAGPGGYDILMQSHGTITNLVNGQTTALVYAGKLPDNYYTYFNTPGSYGKASFSILTSYTLANYGIRIASGQNYVVGTYANVITADSALTFASLEAIAGVSYHLVDAGGGLAWNLVIDSVDGSRVYNAAHALGNQPAYNGAHVVDASPSLLALFAPLTTTVQLSDAASQTLPLLTADAGQATLHTLGDLNHVIQARNEANVGMSSGDDFLGDKRFWLKPFGSWSDQQDQDGVSGYQGRVGGLALGADGAVSASSRFGVAFAYAHADIDSNSTSAPQSSRIDLYQLIGYGSHDLDPDTELNYQIDIGHNTNRGQRALLFTGQTASSNYDTFTAHAGLGLSRNMTLSSANTFVPSVRVDYTAVHDRAYGESGAGLLDLNVDARTTEQLLFSVDGKWGHRLNDRTQLLANLGAGYDALAEQASLTSTYAGAPGQSFATVGMAPKRWLWHGGLGVRTTTGRGLEVTGRYDVEAQSGYTNQTVSAKLRWAF